jgi:hypothetical protein
VSFCVGPLASAAAAAATASTAAAASTKSAGVLGHETEHSNGAASAKLRLGIKRPSSSGVAVESPSEPKQAKKGKNIVLFMQILGNFIECFGPPAVFSRYSIV